MAISESDQGEQSVNRETSSQKGREHYPEIEVALGYTFKDHGWLERALTHRSLHPKGNKSDYERLEFLGDAVLDLAVAHLLLEVHGEAREGELSKMRAALVNTSSLAEIARRINLGSFIRLSRGELASGGAERSSILADVLEAVMGAIYREAGYPQALEVALNLFGDQIRTVMPRDPKTELQEVLHARGKDAPQYLLECVEGPEHAPTFISVVLVDQEICGRGRGATKKASQQEAASEALNKFRKHDNTNTKKSENEALTAEHIVHE
jgi:ribonuclease III